MSSIPPWKQAIYERRKKQDEEEKRKKSEDEAYLASLPPWKRALVLRQREKKDKETPSSPVDRSDSFTKRPVPPQKKEDSPWVKASSGRSSSISPVHKPATPVSSQPAARHDLAPKAAATSSHKKASPEPVPSSGPVFHRERAASTPEHVMDKRRSFEEDDPKYSNMPAWKKALIMRRKASQSKESVKTEERAKSPPYSEERAKSPLYTEARAKSSPYSEERAKSPPYSEGRATSPPYSEERAKSPPYSEERAKSPPYSEGRASSPPYSGERAKSPSYSEGRAKSPPYSEERAKSPPYSEERAKSPPYSEERAKSPLYTEARAKSPPYSEGWATSPPYSEERAKSPPYSEGRASSPPYSGERAKSPSYSEGRAKSPPYSEERAKSPEGRAKSPPYPASSAVTQERANSPPSSVNKLSTVRKAAPPPRSQPIPKRSAPPPPTSKGTSKPEPRHSSNLSNKKLPTSKPRPEVVNRNPSEAQPSKLVEKEGVTLHPPVFKEVEQWANVTEKDPKFQNLPQWKQALIRRRRADIAKRTANPPESPSPTEKVHVHTPWSPRSSLDTARAAEIPKWKQDVLKKKREGLTNPANIGLEHDHSKSQPKDVRGSNVKALLDRFNKGGPPQQVVINNRPSVVRAQSPPKQETRQVTTFHITPSGDSSDEELEEIPLTSIDDEISSESTDEDDSGIVAKRRGSDLGPLPQVVLLTSRSLSPSGSSAPAILIEERRPSILIDPERRPMKGLRRVSFSETELVQEFVYPKYDYKDYEALLEEDEASETGSERGNLGLFQRLHPSLRPNSPDKDPYSSNSPVKQSSPQTDIHRYTPKSLPSYEDAIRQHLSGHYPPSLSHQGHGHDDEESSDAMPASDDQVDFYATLNSDAAALMW